jgi:hypothetical protein
MDNSRTLKGYASGVDQRPGRERPDRPDQGAQPAPTRRPRRQSLRAPISAILTGARGDHARCAAPPPPCRVRPPSGSADTAKAAPKQQRQHQAKGPGDHQDDPDRVEIEPRGGDVYREGQDGPTTSREMLTPRLTLGGYCPPTGICRVAGMWSPAEACCLRSQHAWIRWPEVGPSPRS